MAKSYLELQQKLRFDELMAFLGAEFESIPDHRTGNATKYVLADVLKSAFALFSLKSPSLLDFKKQTVPEASNLGSIYQVKGAIPCDNQMRGILDPLDPVHLRPLFRSFFLRLQPAGVIRDYYYWQKLVIVSVDGVEHFSSTAVHCPHCTTRTHRDGTLSYHHAGLAAVIVNPAQREVFPLDFEPILNADGAQKNDCERNAAKRLCAALAEQYPELEILLVEDALYANAPHIRQITGNNWKYVLNVKPDSHESLFKQFARRHATSLCLDQRVVFVRERDRHQGQFSALRTNDTGGRGHALDLDHQFAADCAHGGASNARRAQPVENRERDLQYLKEPGLSLRAQLRARAAALGDGARVADVPGLSGRSNPTTLLPALSPVVARAGHEGQTLGDAPQRLPGAHFSFNGKLVPPHRFSLPLATGMKLKLRIAANLLIVRCPAFKRKT